MSSSTRGPRTGWRERSPGFESWSRSRRESSFFRKSVPRSSPTCCETSGPGSLEACHEQEAAAVDHGGLGDRADDHRRLRDVVGDRWAALEPIGTSWTAAFGTITPKVALRYDWGASTLSTVLTEHSESSKRNGWIDSAVGRTEGL